MIIPNTCPSCNESLSVKSLECEHCHTIVSGQYDLPWLLKLNAEEQQLVQDFLLSSGSIKEMSSKHNVSYPTMRNRLDDLIQKIKNEIEL